MSKSDLKSMAINLRKHGRSVGEVMKAVGVSKSTASSWCREVELTAGQKMNLREKAISAGHKGRLLGSSMNHQKKLDMIAKNFAEARATIGKISNRDLLIAGAALYWGEGSKSERTGGFVFVNSDPMMVLFMKSFLEDVFRVSADRFLCTVQINEAHRVRIKKVLNFWAKLLQLPTEQFTKPYFVKVRANKVYANFENYYGVFRLKVRKSREMKQKMLGLISALKTQLPE